MANRAHSTPVSDVHPLTGSSTPGSVFPNFNPVAEMFSTFVSLGDAAHAVVASLPGRRAAPDHPDAEVIDLDERVVALAEREARASSFLGTIQDHITFKGPQHPMRDDARPGAKGQVREMGLPDLRELLESQLPHDPTPEWVADVRKSIANMEAYEAAVKAMELQFDLARIEKRQSRMFRRLKRWAMRLTAMEPQTQAGLKAKAEAQLAIERAGNFDTWTQDLATSVARDAVRIATADVETLAYGTALHRLRSEHERVAPLRDTAYDAWTAADDRYQGPALPDALRFQASTDASSIGSYQNVRAPFGYTDPRQIEALRTSNYSRPEHRTRRDEIVSAYDRWIAECLAARAAAGIDTASEHFWTLAGEASQLRLQMIKARATSISDLWHKVAVALECFDGVSGLEEELAGNEVENGTSGNALGLSILLDLGRMLAVQDSARKPYALTLDDQPLAVRGAA